MTEKQRAYLILHFCVIVWGFTAILGKLISLQALPLVWWRVFLCSITLFFVVNKAERMAPGLRGALRMLGIGMVIGVHWLCFYGAIKLSNASVALAMMAMTSFFSALVEPLILKKRFVWRELVLGILILPGMWLIIDDLDWTMRQGVMVGTLSALLAAIFTSLNKREIDLYSPKPLTMSFYELTGGVIITSIALVVVQPDWKTIVPVGIDWLWLFILAYFCTLLTHFLVLKAMRHLGAFTVNLTTNLEPVYGIALAILIFREDQHLHTSFYIGVLIVLCAVLSHPFLKGVDKAVQVVD